MPLPQPSSTSQTTLLPSILAQHHPRPSRIPSPQVRYPFVPTGHRAATHRYHARLRRRCVAKARKVALQRSCPRLLPIAKRAWSTSRPVARWTVIGLRRANAGSRCWAEYVAPLGSDGCPRCVSWLPKGRRIFFLACLLAEQPLGVSGFFWGDLFSSLGSVVLRHSARCQVRVSD